jgi:hypothetical protein
MTKNDNDAVGERYRSQLIELMVGARGMGASSTMETVSEEREIYACCNLMWDVADLSFLMNLRLRNYFLPRHRNHMVDPIRFYWTLISY